MQALLSDGTTVLVHIRQPKSHKRTRFTSDTDDDDDGHHQIQQHLDQQYDQYVDYHDQDVVLSDEEFLPKPKSRRLTRRQRSLYGITSNGDQHEEKPIALVDNGRTRLLSEEQLLKKSENARRKKLLAQRQDEEEKRAVIEKLLKKSKSRMERGDKKKRIQEIRKEMKKKEILIVDKKNAFRHIAKLIDNEDEKCKRLSLAVNVPDGYTLNDYISTKTIAKVPEFVKCFHCEQRKRYSCSRTGLPVCSMECYLCIEA